MRILVGYRPTAQGREALDAAVREARRRDAEVIVFQHVPIASSEQHGAETPEVRAALEVLESEIREQGVSCSSSWSVGGQSGASALLRRADELGADLLVIGIRARSPVGKALLGSDAQDILLQAEVPVLVVKVPGDW